MAGLDIVVSNERLADQPAIDLLEERAFGPGRFARTAFRLREGNPHSQELSLVARVSTLVVGSIRLTQIRIGKHPALLLGPLTVDPAFRSKGIGRMLIEQSLEAAREKGHRLVLLVGDEPYYSRVGFKRVPMGTITMPGPVDPSRVLLRELVEGAMTNVSGVVSQ
ncbi:MAG: GNAT family N-acetyltransferase [Beijerinckiaceae bacterium]